MWLSEELAVAVRSKVLLAKKLVGREEISRLPERGGVGKGGSSNRFCGGR